MPRRMEEPTSHDTRGALTRRAPISAKGACEVQCSEEISATLPIPTKKQTTKAPNRIPLGLGSGY